MTVDWPLTRDNRHFYWEKYSGIRCYLRPPALPYAANRFVGSESDADMGGNSEEVGERAYTKNRMLYQ